MTGRPFARIPGREPAIVCLHASGSSSRQWDALARHLADSHRIVAPDLAGHGASPGWRAGEQARLAGEAARLSPFLGTGARVHLVGHSYGAAVALRLALDHPRRVASLALYEPVLIRLLLDVSPRHEAGEEMVAVAARIRECLAAGAVAEAARVFVDYWSGEGAWSGIGQEQRAGIAARMPAVIGCFDALFGDDTAPASLARLDVPVLLMSGTASPASARGISRRLAATLPRVRWRVFPGLGHMGPVTHAMQVNEAITVFLGQAARGAMPGQAATAASQPLVPAAG